MGDVGIETVSREERYGKPVNLLSLWFMANVSIAPFALGFVPALFHMSFSGAISSVIAGTFFGSVFVAINSVMGPRKGKVQMMISEETFERSNIFPSFMQWFTTLGWASVNLILGIMAFVILVPLNTFSLLILYASLQVLIVFLGYNFINKFAKIVSLSLAVLFLYISVAGIYFGKFTTSLSYNPVDSVYVWGAAFSLSFGYVASWSPCGADYSRYLPESASGWRVFFYTLSGNFLSTVWLEILGFIVLLSTSANNTPVEAAYQISGHIGILTLIAFVLGGIGTNTINLYSNSLALNTIFKKAKRTTLLVISAAIATILGALFYATFFSFYEDLLSIFNYWIMPWLGVLFADYFLVKRGNALRAISSYAIGVLAMIPFIDHKGLYSGFLARFIGFDVSYFVAFFASFLAYLILSGYSQK